MPINKKKHIVYLFLCFLAGSFLYYFRENRSLRAFVDIPKTGSGIKMKGEVKVVIRGAVRTPGLYILREGNRLEDLIKKGGGLTCFSDRGRVARERRLVDGSEYYIPFRKLKKGERIDINRASLEELRMVPDVSPALAREILMYRDRYERFDEMEELKDVDGVGEIMYGRIREFMTIGE